jgi:serine/threonine-protein kinase
MKSETPPEGRATAGPARMARAPKITERHYADLEGEAAPTSSARRDKRDPFVGRAIAGGKLEIESLVGRGMMGAVYRAVHRELRNAVAVKILHEAFQHDVDFGRRFHAEALAASRLDHPNLVRVYDYGQEPDGVLYIAMEFLDGVSLRTMQQATPRFSTERVVELMLQVTAGLSHAHHRGIIHRDVKPDNVVVLTTLDDDGGNVEVVKVCDFGLALLKAGDALRERFAGTPVYMSPEQCRGEELDARSDVYSCGIMMYELLTGQVPFLSDKPIVIVNRHLSMPPPPMAEHVPNADPRLERIVQKALRKSREERYASMRELRADLKDVLAPDPTAEVSRPSPPSSRGRPATISVPPAEPPRRESKAPAWLEEKGDAYARLFTGMATGTATESLADVLARDPKTWLRKLVDDREARSFAQKATELDRAVRTLAQRADAKTLYVVASAIHGLATQTSQDTGRGAHVTAIARLFADPGMLGPIAERLIVKNDDASEAARALLVHARTAGAYALYGARVKNATNAAVRHPFVATMTSIGEAAWPVVRAALERIPQTALTGEHPLASDLAEDLLWCVPKLRDEAAGHAVAPWVRARVPSLSRAATRALARVWTDRARPMLLALLSQEDEGLKAAAIAGLSEIGAMDEHTVRRIAPLVAQGAASAELRLAALAALTAIADDARSVAIPLLMQMVRDPSAPDDAVFTAARSLLTIAPERLQAVLERAEKSPEPLRSQLAALRF